MSEIISIHHIEDLPAAVTHLLQQVAELRSMVQSKPFANGYPANEDPIDRAELCKRLNVSEPTIISMERKNKIPVMYLGKLARYNWYRVVEALEKK